MSDKKIVELQLRTSVIDTVNFPSDDGIQSYRVTAAQIFDYMRAKFATVRSLTAPGTIAQANVVILLDATAGAFTQPLPAIAGLNVGTTWTFKNIGTANAVTIDPNSAETIDGVATLDLQPGDSVKLFNTGAAWITLEANLTVLRSRLTAAERIPTGVVFPYGGLTIPTGYLGCDGSALSRSTYANLFAALTLSLASATTNASTSVTGLSSTTKLGVGMPVEGAGIPAGTTIATIVNSTSITLSAAATATGTPTLRFIPHGVGDGSTTFNLPDTRGLVIRSNGTNGATLNGKVPASLSLGQRQGDATAPNGLTAYQDGHQHATGHVQERSQAGNYRYGMGDVGWLGAGMRDAASQMGESFSPWTNWLQPPVYVNGGGAETRGANISLNHVIKY